MTPERLAELRFYAARESSKAGVCALGIDSREMLDLLAALDAARRERDDARRDARRERDALAAALAEVRGLAEAAAEYVAAADRARFRGDDRDAADGAFVRLRGIVLGEAGAEAERIGGGR